MVRFNFSPRSVAYSLDPTRYNNIVNMEPVWADNIADAEVVAIWERYRSRLTPLPKMEVITALVTRAAQLIGDLRSFLLLNFTKNPVIAESTQRFIVDCINFANGGNRDYSMSTWYDLVDVREELERPLAGRDLLANTHIPTTDVLIANWLSREGGVDDFFVSMNILFGNR